MPADMISAEWSDAMYRCSASPLQTTPESSDRLVQLAACSLAMSVLANSRYDSSLGAEYWLDLMTAAKTPNADPLADLLDKKSR
jgi:hypothetical protein